jgi:hypothetical protein
MLSTLVAASLMLAPQGKSPTLKLLFLGNSHTQGNNLAQMVKGLLESDGSKRTVEVQVISGAMLNDIAKNPEAMKTVKEPKWDAVILQGASLSSSHKYNYSQAGGIELATQAKKAGNRPILFAEWPRKGWNETDYILGIYKKISSASGAEIAPVCRVWDAVLKKQAKLDLWQSDGNHAKAPGSYIAAVTIYRKLLGEKAKSPTWVPGGVDPKLAPVVMEAAKATVK